MSAMSRLYGEIEDMYHRGFAEAMIARELNVDVSFIQDVVDAFSKEWDAERHDESVEIG